jgi:hypothetical protein
MGPGLRRVAGRPAGAVSRPAATPAPGTTPALAPTEPAASDRVRALLDGTPVVPVDEAAWFPFRVLQIAARVSGELPAPTAPQVVGDTVVWSLVAPVGADRDAGPRAAVCSEVSRLESRIVCAVDRVTVGAAERARMAFGWRRASGETTADLATPLRALSRLDTGMCLVSAERTLRTLEIRVRAPSVQALGTSLALIAAAPRLSDLILLGREAGGGAGGGGVYHLSWPTDRVDRDTGTLGADPWPSRCDEHAMVGGDAPSRARAMALVSIEGERARGAVVALAQHEWLVTDDDQLGDATVASVTPRGVYLRRGVSPRARPILARFAPRASGSAPSRGPAVQHPGEPGRLPPVHIPTPPEPPALPRASGVP